MTPKWVSRLLLWMGIANLTLALLVPLVSSARVSIGYLVATSVYRELDLNGSINHSKLSETWGTEYVDNWRKVVDRLVGESFADLYDASEYLAAILMMNSAILLVASWRVRSLVCSPGRQDSVRQEA